jgi:TolB-like protein
MTHRSLLRPAVSLCAALALSVVAMTAVPGAQQQPPATQPEQAREGSSRITGQSGGKPKLAVPDFLAATPDAESKAIAATIGQVLWADLDFEREYYMVPRDTYASIPVPASIDAVPFDRWKELGADGLVIGAVRKTATGVTVQVKLYNVTGQTAAFSKEYSGTAPTRASSRTRSPTRSTSSSAT